MRQRLVGVVLAGAIAVAIALPVVGRGVRADASGAYTADAAAASARYSVTFPNFPVTPTPVDLGATQAQTHVDSLGNSTSFAASPHPGSLVLSVPGLIPGLIPGFPALPEYPLSVESSHPDTPSAEESAGPVALRASSQAKAGSASCVIGEQGTSAGSATADVYRDGDDLVAESRGITSDVTLGPVAISSVRSAATVRLRSDGSIARSSDLSIAAVEIAGTAVRITPNGLELSATPIPGLDLGEVDGPADPHGLAAINDVLDQAGISLTYLTEEKTETGIISAGLLLSYKVDGGSLGLGTVEVILGQSSASASGAPAFLPTSSPPPTPQSVMPVTPKSPVPTTPHSTSLPTAPVEVAAPAAPNPPPAVNSPRPAGSSVMPMERFSALALYPVLALAGLAALTLSQLTRIIAVRRPWMS